MDSYSDLKSYTQYQNKLYFLFIFYELKSIAPSFHLFSLLVWLHNSIKLLTHNNTVRGSFLFTRNGKSCEKDCVFVQSDDNDRIYRLLRYNHVDLVFLIPTSKKKTGYINSPDLFINQHHSQRVCKYCIVTWNGNRVGFPLIRKWETSVFVGVCTKKTKYIKLHDKSPTSFFFSRDKLFKLVESVRAQT